MSEREEAIAQILGGFGGGLIFGGGWLAFAIFVWQLPWFWWATFNESGWWVLLALLLTFIASIPLLLGISLGVGGLRKLQLSAIPPQFREQVTQFQATEASWSQVNKHHEEHLEKWSSGDEVRKLQELLNEHGASLSVDGSFGDLTYKEVVKFQTDNGLTVDGVVGSQTWGALTKPKQPDSESEGGPSVYLNKESFEPQELIAVTFENGPGNPSDWIGIYRKEAPSDGENHHGNWVYSNGSGAVFAEASEGPRNGTVTFSDGMGEGGYEARFFANNGYELLASVPFEVSIDDGPTEEESEEIQLLKQMREAGRSADECRLVGFSAEQCRDAGYSADELLELCFPPYGEPRVYNWNGYEGSNIICEGKFGVLTFVHPGFPEDIRVEYLDGSTNSVNTHAECLATDGYGSPSIERGSVRLLRWDVEVEVESLADVDVEALAQAVEEISADPDFDGEVTNLRVLAEEEMESRIKKLPAPIQERVRAKFTAKMDRIEIAVRDRIPDAEVSAKGVAKGAAAVGAAALTAAAISSAAKQMASKSGIAERAEVIFEDGEVDLDEVKEQVSELIEGMDVGEPEFGEESPTDGEPVTDAEPQTDTEPPKDAEYPVDEGPQTDTDSLADPEPATDSEPATTLSVVEQESSEFIRLASDTISAMTSSTRSKIVEEQMTGEWPVSVVIDEIHRTMGVGLDTEYKNGKTIEGVIEGTDIAVSILASSLKHPNLDEFEQGMTFVSNVSVKEYRPGLKRFQLLA